MSIEDCRILPRLLFITPFPVNDFSFGGAQRANHLRNALKLHAAVDTVIITYGHTFLLEKGWSTDRVRQARYSQYGLSFAAVKQRRQLTQWIASLVERERYDFIVVQHLSFAALLPRRLRARMIFDADDFVKIAPSGTSLLARVWLQIRNVLARRIAKQALHVWYVSPKKKDLPPNPRRSFMPNVVNIPNPERLRPPPTAHRFLMVGQFIYPPNIEGLSWFVEHVWPTLVKRFPSAELHAVGTCQKSLPHKLREVNFRGYVDDIAFEYDHASIVIAPIFSGGGTQIKVIDALVHERPLISSSFSYLGFADHLINGEHLLVANSQHEWIAACTTLLEDPAKGEEMAKRGGSRAALSFGPERMSSEVQSTLEKLTQKLSNTDSAP